MLPVGPVKIREVFLYFFLLGLREGGTIRVEQFDPVVLLGVVGGGDHAPGFCNAGAVCHRGCGGNPGEACVSTRSAIRNVVEHRT